MLARLSDEMSLDLPPLFFGHPSDPSKEHNDRPVITLGLTGSGLKVVGYGPEAAALVYEKAGAIQGALIREANCLVQAHMIRGEHSFDFRPMPLRYFIPRLQLGKARDSSVWHKLSTKVTEANPWHEVAATQLSNSIALSLASMTKLLLDEGDDVEGSAAEMIGAENLTHGHIDKLQDGRLNQRLKIQIHHVEGHSRVRKNGPQGMILCLHGVEFTMHAELGGLWTVGHSRISGSGDVLPSSRTWGPKK